MNKTPVRAFFVFAAVLAILLATALVFAARRNRVMLFHHGTPEVPQGHAFAIMSPFRDRSPEDIAEELMSDLRTNRCEQILRSLRSEDSRTCSIMRANKSARLIWRQDNSTNRLLVYDLPESKSRLWITSHLDEVGFVVSGVSLIR